MSIILPVLNEADNLACLGRSPNRNLPGVEWIVVDGGSQDDSVGIAETWADQVVTGFRGRAAQMNAGASSARGRALLFLHADTRLPGNFADFVETLGRESPLWGFFPVELQPGSPMLRVIARMMNWRSRLTSVATGDQTIFIRRDVFQRVDGYPPLPLMEDVAISKQLRKLAKPYIWPSPVVSSSRRWQQAGVIRTMVLMWYLRLLFVLGVSPTTLHKRYYGS
ncbi:TIGR04283 family arsenosugar biosynthesis glycosyltransferase [Litorivivens sp.]|uniref:TIGR04283 family arsenosugar biosynthesis glycosyltransferase n=1 Tax=Litorivivens sp. TaxID=2020868 RepID=UPI003568D297